MSRIEEALRRADPETAERISDFVLDDRRRRPRGSELEQYAPEASVETLPVVVSERHAVEPVPIRGAQPAVTAPRPLAPGYRQLTVTAGAPGISVEQYRRVAATLYQAKTETGLKSLMVCSALPREGKTLTAANLALTLSESYGQRVLIIDADLRSPSLHEVFDLPVSPGLANFLGNVDVTLPVVSVSPTLSVLCAGAAAGSPLAGLVSERMKQLVSEAASRFDWVLVDTPPVGVLSDAHLVAALTEAVVFVVAAGSTPYRMVQRAVATVGADRVIGVVLNRVAASVLPPGSYYDRYDRALSPSTD